MSISSRTTHGLVVALSAAVIATSATAGTIVYVDDDAPPGGDGASWSTAFRYLQDALDAAAQAGSGITEIRIAQGTYRPGATESNPANFDRNSTFAMIQGVTFAGGYLGLSAKRGQNPDARDVTQYQTILSGDLAGNDGPGMTFINTEENAYQVVVALNVDATAVLDGLIIEGGRADGPALGPTPASRDQGSGLNIYFASPTIMNCTFRRNWALNHGTINDHGDKTTVINCTFTQNYADQFGAGLYVHHHTMTMAMGCLFEHNGTPGQGAGAYSRSMHGAMLMGCTFRYNWANEGAGMYNNVETNTVLMNCSFVENVAAVGGGLYTLLGSPTVTDSEFRGNIATEENGGGGGGMWNAGGEPVVHNCVFDGNVGALGAGLYHGDGALGVVTDSVFTNNVGTEGAGVYNLLSDAVMIGCTFMGNVVAGGGFPVGGAMSNYFCNPIVDRCHFANNSATLGGGAIYHEGDNAILTNCTFLHNTSIGKDGWGGAILHGYSSATIATNCLFTGNTAEQGGAVFSLQYSLPTHVNCTYVGNTAKSGGAVVHAVPDSAVTIANAILWHNGSTPIDGIPIDITYSCIEGGYAGAGNINVAPGFVQSPDAGQDRQWGTSDDDYGDLRLLSGSPCVDAGDNTAVPSATKVDLDGNPRFMDDPSTPDTGNPDGTHALVDMGAYELPAALCPADIAPPASSGGGDGVVNVEDLLLVINQWGPSGGYGPADINNSGAVDIVDLLTVINAWGACQ